MSEYRFNLIDPKSTVDEEQLRRILARDQMKEFAKNPLVMARAEGVRYWDVNGKEYLDGLSGIYVASVGHANPRVLEAVRRQMEVLTFAPGSTTTTLSGRQASSRPREKMASMMRFDCSSVIIVQRLLP